MNATHRKCSLGRVGRCALLVGLFAWPSTASASLTLRLGFANGLLSKELNAADVGTDVPIIVWASVTGPGASPEGVQSAYFRLTTFVLGAAAPATGDFISGGPVTPFSSSGSQIGQLVDLNADGMIDVGHNGATPNASYARASALAMQTNGGVPTANGREWKIAEYLFHIDSISSTTAPTDRLTLAVGFPSFDAMPRAVWREDGVDKSTSASFGSPGTLLVGNTVTFTAVPEPSTLGLVLAGIAVVCSRGLRRRFSGG